MYQCNVCGLRFPVAAEHDWERHVLRCVERNADFVDSFRTRQPFEGDPELAAFARAEGDVHRRRPGNRRRPR